MQLRVVTEAQRLVAVIDRTRSPGVKGLRLFDESDTACVAGGGLELCPDFHLAAHEHIVERTDFPAAPTFVVAVNQAPGIDEELQGSECTLFQDLGVDLSLQFDIDGHGANKASRSVELSSDGEPLSSA